MLSQMTGAISGIKVGWRIPFALFHSALALESSISGLDVLARYVSLRLPWSPRRSLPPT